MPQSYKNLGNDDLRRFILNGIVWTAKLGVPADGIRSTKPELEVCNPEAVEFVPWRGEQ